MEDATLYTLIASGIGAVGTAIKIYVDYKRNKNALDRADKAEARAHELNLIKTKSDAALRASVVGIERHKKTMTLEGQLALAKSIQDAAIEESAEDFLSESVDKITKKAGTKFYSPEELKRKLDEESNT
jgi:hypothetical protein